MVFLTDVAMTVGCYEIEASYAGHLALMLADFPGYPLRQSHLATDGSRERSALGHWQA